MTGLPAGAGKSDSQMLGFYEQHYQHIRDHVRSHPSHRLVEIEIENPNTKETLFAAFGFPRRCWGHANTSPKVVPKEGRGR